jgi:hypothetical protein
MRNGLLVLALCALVLVSGAASASERWVSFGTDHVREVEVDVISSDMSGVTLAFTIPGAVAEDVTTKGGEYVRLTLPGHGHTTVPGEAGLPMLRELVQIPEGAVPRLQVVSRDSRVVTLRSLGVARPLLPVQPPVEKLPGAIEDAAFVLSGEYYGRDQLQPREIATVGGARTLRERRYVQLEIAPVRYNPSEGTVEVTTELVVEIGFDRADHAATRRAMERYSNARFDRLAGDLFVNADAFATRYDIPLPIEYVIVVHDDFYDAILPLADWRHLKGHHTTVVKTSEIPGGNTKQNIKAYIQDAYDNWPAPPTYVLLVGDTQYIDYWVGVGSNSPATDLYYVTMDGPDDWDPDIWIGRFSCTSASQVTNLVNKTVDYERYDLASGTDWVKKAVFMASCDNSSITEGTHEYVINEYLDPRGYYSQRLYCTQGATANDVSAALNEGRSLCIYSGHGSVTSWSDGPPYNGGHVNALQNTDKLPLVHSYACDTGRYSAACFGENWINAPGRGALVFWGSSVTSYWGEDDILEKGAFEAFFGEGYTWACGVTHRAMYHLLDHYGPGGSTRRYFEMYNILGDPAVDFWTEPPTELSVSHPAAIPIGLPTVSVSVSESRDPVEDALVSVVKADEGLHVTGRTDAAGQAMISLDPVPMLTGSLDVTVTKHDCYAYEGVAAVTNADVPFCIYDSYTIDDDGSGGSSGNGDGQVAAGEAVELTLTLRNVGLVDGEGVVATISTDDPYVTVTDNTEDFGTIPAGGTAQSLEDYDFAVAGNCGDGHEAQFEVTASDGDSTWVSYFSVGVGAPDLVLADWSVDDPPPGGDGDGCPNPGETIVLIVTLENVGSEPAYDITAGLSSVDPYVVVGGGSAGAAVIEPGGTGELGPGFTVTLSPDTPPLHLVNYEVAVGTAIGYEGTVPLTAAVAGGLDEDFEVTGQDWGNYVVTDGSLNQWHVSDYRSHSGSYSWKYGGPGGGYYMPYADAAVETPELCLGSGCEMIMWHRLDALEDGTGAAEDCAIVEISSDGGATWSLLVPDGGYSHLKNDDPTNPLPEGTPCWSGSFDWRQDTFDLSAYVGTGYLVRFRFAADSYAGQEGWYVDDLAISCSPAGIDEGEVGATPSEFALFQNAPNPFNPVTTIGYALPERAHVTISVYNVAGALVRTLVDGEQDAGSRSVVWDGRNEAGGKVGSGVYFCRMSAGSFTDRRLMVLLK